MMQREMIIQKLKESGCRITKQRLMLLDIILEEDCSCCKEIYFKASKVDPKIGVATVYRMVNAMEDIGAIKCMRGFQLAGSEELKKAVCRKIGRFFSFIRNKKYTGLQFKASYNIMYCDRKNRIKGA